MLNIFRMFGKMSGQRVEVTSNSGLNAELIRANNVRTNPDVSALASLDNHQLAILLWHYHDDDLPDAPAAVAISLRGLPLNLGQAKVTHYRVDADHSNAYEAWKRIGSPAKIAPEQFADLEKAGQLAEHAPLAVIDIKDGKAIVNVCLPRQAVSLLVVTW